MLFVFRCLKSSFLADETEAAQKIVASDGFRCVCCQGATNDLGVHSLIPADEVIKDLCLTVCYWCHVKIHTGKIFIKNHPKAHELLIAWAKKHPKALVAHAKYFPDEIRNEENEKKEERAGSQDIPWE